MPTATEMTSERRLSRTSKGWEGRSVWRVDTADEYAALSATGLPVIGTAYPGGLPANLLASRIEPGHMGGANGGGSVGWTRVEVTYQSQGASSSSTPVVPQSGVGYCDCEIGVQQITTYTAVNAAGVPVASSDLIAGGEGAPKDVAQCILRIVRYYTPAALTGSLLNSWLAIVSTINNATVDTPPLLGEGGTLTFAAGELRYRAPRIEKVGDLIQVTHEIVASPTGHDYKWATVAANGTATGATVTSKIYPDATWPSL